MAARGLEERLGQEKCKVSEDEAEVGVDRDIRLTLDHFCERGKTQRRESHLVEEGLGSIRENSPTLCLQIQSGALAERGIRLLVNRSKLACQVSHSGDTV